MDIQQTPRHRRHGPKFSNHIREYRLKAGLSQRKLAQLVGRGEDAISSWERGQTLPNVPHLMCMAKTLGTLAESLYIDFYVVYPREGEKANSASP